MFEESLFLSGAPLPCNRHAQNVLTVGCGVHLPRSIFGLSVSFLPPYRLKDVEHSHGKLYLVFEWLDKDLSKYMSSTPDGMPMPLVKVRPGWGLNTDLPCKHFHWYH